MGSDCAPAIEATQYDMGGLAPWMTSHKAFEELFIDL
jgi:hypothetical protein